MTTGGGDSSNGGRGGANKHEDAGDDGGDFAMGRRLTADDLMDGPRGRRLVLEYARLVVDELWAAGRDSDRARLFATTMFYASHNLDPNPGTLFSINSDDTTRREEGPDEGGHRLAARAGALLSPLLDHLPSPSVERLHRAWMVAIGAARYWQEPDGYDIAVENPRLASALRKVARALADCSLLESYAAAADPDRQFAIELFDVPDDDSAAYDDSPPSTPTEVPDTRASEDMWTPPPAARPQLLQWWQDTVDWEHGEQQEPALPLGAYSGAWWSAPVGRLVTSTGPYACGPHGTIPDGSRTDDTIEDRTNARPDVCPTGMYLIEDDADQERALVRRIIVTDRSLPIYEVHEPDDWVRLAHDFPLEVSASRRHDWYNATGREGRWVIPDWHQVANRYAGVHVSLAGYLRTAGKALPVDGLEWLPDAAGRSATGAPATVMAGWDPDQTYWLHDAIAFDKAWGTQAWHWDGDDLRWMREAG